MKLLWRFRIKTSANGESRFRIELAQRENRQQLNYCGIILIAGGGGGDGDALLLLQRDLDRRGQAGEQLPRTISPSNSISLCR